MQNRKTVYFKMGANRRNQHQSSETRTSGRHNISRNRYAKRYESKEKEKDNGILINTRYTCLLLAIGKILIFVLRRHSKGGKQTSQTSFSTLSLVAENNLFIKLR